MTSPEVGVGLENYSSRYATVGRLSSCWALASFLPCSSLFPTLSFSFPPPFLLRLSVSQPLKPSSYISISYVILHYYSFRKDSHQIETDAVDSYNVMSLTYVNYSVSCNCLLVSALCRVFVVGNCLVLALLCEMFFNFSQSWSWRVTKCKYIPEKDALNWKMRISAKYQVRKADIISSLRPTDRCEQRQRWSD